MLDWKIDSIKRVLRDGKFAIVRDFDGEMLCILGYEDDNYFVYTLEQAPFSGTGVGKDLRNSAGVEFIDAVNETILKENEKELTAQKIKSNLA